MTVSFREALHTWMRVGLLSFGGPAGQIATMHRILVEEKRWISEDRFLHALNYCMLLPGPEAQQLAVYVGWLLHGTRGGLAAGILFVLPGFLAIMAFSLVYVLWGQTALVDGLFLGLKAAVIALVIQALIRVGGRALRRATAFILAALGFIAIAFLDAPFPLIIATAALFGYLWTRSGRKEFLASANTHGGTAIAAPPPVVDQATLTRVAPSWRRAVRLLAIWIPLWLAPVAVFALIAGPDHVLTLVGVFFSKMAVVTFGGAYAVLTYVAQQAVEQYEWLTPTQMLDGLGLAETTPGPLILVVQFVGFLAGYQAAEVSLPLVTAVISACLTVWVTFVPCFLWIFLGAPYVESLRENAALSGALAAITAAVVGLIANLALWFTLHALFAEVSELAIGPIHFENPDLSTVRWPLVVLTGLALIMTFGLKWGIARTIAVCVAIGVVWTLLY